MGKVEEFRIMFDNPSCAYYAGQTVTGKVIVRLSDRIGLRGIFINLEGRAHVSWHETESYHDHSSNTRKTRTVTRSASQTYFQLKYPLQGTERIENLGPGEIYYPFSVGLPLNLPSSFEGKHGHIRYTCSANISRPWKFDPKCKAAFTVLEIVDLNFIPGAASATSQQDSKRTGCCCCKGGPMSATVSLNKQGFVPGENIYIKADIDNSSDEAISSTTASLLCWITYIAEHQRKREVKMICSTAHGAIQARSTEQWMNQPLLIPAIPPTLNGTKCRVINMEYFVKFSVDPSGTFSTDLDFNFPITIGSIPLRTDFNMFSASRPLASASAPPLLDFGNEYPAYPAPAPSAPLAMAPSTLNMYPDMPPPSYEECVDGRVDIREEDDQHITGELNFAPRYMYYNQAHPPPYQ